VLDEAGAEDQVKWLPQVDGDNPRTGFSESTAVPAVPAGQIQHTRVLEQDTVLSQVPDKQATLISLKLTVVRGAAGSLSRQAQQGEPLTKHSDNFLTRVC